MITLVHGKDRRAVKEATQKEIKKVVSSPKDLKNTGFFVYEGREIEAETLFVHANIGSSLFESKAVVIIKDVSESKDLSSILRGLLELAKSDSHFYFAENSPKKDLIEAFKISKASFVEVKDKVEVKKDDNPFLIANLLERKDKFGMWTLYMKKLKERETFMSMSGIINWKIRDMIAKGKYGKWTKEELVDFSMEMLQIESVKRNKRLDMELEFEKLILSI